MGLIRRWLVGVDYLIWQDGWMLGGWAHKTVYHHTHCLFVFCVVLLSAVFCVLCCCVLSAVCFRFLHSIRFHDTFFSVWEKLIYHLIDLGDLHWSCTRVKVWQLQSEWHCDGSRGLLQRIPPHMITLIQCPFERRVNRRLSDSQCQFSCTSNKFTERIEEMNKFEWKIHHQ